MITAKFGGTAVTPRNLYRIKDIITSNHCCVVVSATGKENDGDIKVTDLLRQAYFSLPNLSAFYKVAEKYRRLVQCNSVNIDIDSLLFDAQKRLQKCDSVQYAMSLGEEISAKIVAKFLCAEYIEAQDVVRFSNKGLCYRDTLSRLSSALKGVKQVVLAGFYGGYNLSRQTFSRGGSDITGALVANAANCQLYENWTDVNGFYVADPHKIPNVRTVRCMSYDDMRLLASSGAGVLHPDAVRPVEEKGIAINIRNFYNLQDAGTLVSHNIARDNVLGITEKRIENRFVTMVVFTVSQSKIVQCLAKFFADCAVEKSVHDIKLPTRNKFGITDYIVTSNTLQITSTVSLLDSLYTFLPID